MTTLLRTALFASVLLLSGCLRSATTVEVDESGGGTATVVLAIDPVRTAELAAETGGLAASTLSAADNAQLCEQFRQLALPANLPPSATVVDYDADGLCGHQIEFTFADGDELAQTLDQVTGGQAGDLDRFVLAPEGDDWLFTAPLGGLSTALQSAASTFPPAVVDTALDNTAVSYELTLPGTAVEGANNANEVDGGTFRWNVDAANPPDTLMARSTVAGGGSSLLPWILIGVGLLAVVGLGAVVLARRNSSDSSAAASAGSPAGGPTPAADYPPPAASTPAAAPPPSGGMSPEAGIGAPPPSAADPSATAFAPPAPSGGIADTTHAPPPGDAATSQAEDEPMDMAGAEPRWDPERRAWVADHAVEGLLIHDEATGQWRRA